MTRKKRTAPTTISDQLRALIAGSELSQNEIARRADIDRSQLSRFMRGVGAMKTDSSLDRVCEVLDLELRQREQS